MLLPMGCAVAQNWNLVWSDEFDGPDIDTSKWSHEINGSGGGNNELQYYTDRATNSFIENGNLVIQALDETFTGSDGTRDYTSARLVTQGKFERTYGRMEARIKIPRGQGIWPAFWMLGNNIGSVGWPTCGEIDIMENIGSEPRTTHGTIHGPGYSGGGGVGGSYTFTGEDAADDFRVFAVEWEPNVIRWYVDGNHYFTATPASLGGSTWVFDHPHFFILNVAVGGSWPGPPDGSTTFPQRMEVDYVRVYEGTIDPGPPTVIQATGTTRLQAEDYGQGGEAVGYHDTDTGNNGNAYRSDNVDIEATQDTGGGFNVGWTWADEWLAYPVDVETSGIYRATFRVASPGGAAFRLELDGTNLTGTVAAPATGGYQNWTSVTRSNLYFTAGEHTLRLHVEASGANYNWMEFTAPAPGQDSDGDGMADTWELQHFNHPTNMPPGLDGDNDGASNVEEYIADTDPTLTSSRLQITGAVSGSDVQILTWPASSARRYSLQTNSDITNPGSWTDLLTDVTPTNSMLSMIDSNSPQGGLFYRVGVSLPSTP